MTKTWRDNEPLTDNRNIEFTRKGLTWRDNEPLTDNGRKEG
jgi:hypothetical protein